MTGNVPAVGSSCSCETDEHKPAGGRHAAGGAGLGRQQLGRTSNDPDAAGDSALLPKTEGMAVSSSSHCDQSLQQAPSGGAAADAHADAQLAVQATMQHAAAAAQQQPVSPGPHATMLQSASADDHAAAAVGLERHLQPTQQQPVATRNDSNATRIPALEAELPAEAAKPPACRTPASQAAAVRTPPVAPGTATTARQHEASAPGALQDVPAGGQQDVTGLECTPGRASALQEASVAAQSPTRRALDRLRSASLSKHLQASQHAGGTAAGADRKDWIALGVGQCRHDAPASLQAGLSLDCMPSVPWLLTAVTSPLETCIKL